jgi:alkaline phosphatase D
VIGRRRFLESALLPFAAAQAPAVITAARERPVITHGVQSGDVTSDSALIWARADRPSRLVVEYSTDERFGNAARVAGPVATAATDFTAQVGLQKLPPERPFFYRVHFESLAARRAISESYTGSFRTAPRTARKVRLAWTGDTVGQGWGISQSFGGLRLYETMTRQDPDLFVHSGDIIYADGPLVERVPLDDGTVWTNVVTPAKSHVAETLDDFRGNFAYNRLDAHALRFSASVPLVAQWDDHEVTNNWYPGESIDDVRYTERRASVLADRSRRAMFEWVPIRQQVRGRVYRKVNYGPTLDVFVLDCRTYRGPNGPNREPRLTSTATMLGATQLEWLEQALASSLATWKVIACDMPIGAIVPDGDHASEGWANGDDGPPLGREHEIARLLATIKHRRIMNTVWITADVHYAAAHHYDPARARFTNFLPFWEFVAGPMHAGTFGPNRLEATFGPEARFISIPPGMKPNRPPSDGLQFFGTLDCDNRSMVATIWNLAGEKLWSAELEATASR